MSNSGDVRDGDRGDGKLDSTKDIFSNDFDLEKLNKSVSPFQQKKWNGGEVFEYDINDFNMICMGIHPYLSLLLNRSYCGRRVASLLQYDHFSAWNNARQSNGT